MHEVEIALGKGTLSARDALSEQRASSLQYFRLPSPSWVAWLAMGKRIGLLESSLLLSHTTAPFLLCHRFALGTELLLGAECGPGVAGR